MGLAHLSIQGTVVSGAERAATPAAGFSAFELNLMADGR